MILVAVANCGSLFNFLFQWIAARELSEAEYGILGALLALVTYLAIPAQAIQLVTARHATDAHARHGASGVRALVRPILSRVAVLAVAFALVAGLAAPWIRDSLRLPSLVEPSLAIAVAIASLFFFAALGFLQAEYRFGRFGVFHSVIAGAKLVLGGTAAVAGAGLRTVVGCLIVAPAALATHAFLRRLRLPREAEDVAVTPPSLIAEGWPIAVAFGGFAAFLHVDMGFVQAAYGGEGTTSAGVYNAASTLGRAALHLPCAMAAVTFAGVRRAVATGRPTHGYLWKSLLLQLGLAALIALPLGLFAPWVLQIYGGDDRYTDASGLLRSYLVPMVCLGSASILINYEFARGSRRAAGVVALCLGVLVIGLAGHPVVADPTPDTLRWFVSRLTAVSATMVVLLAVIALLPFQSSTSVSTAPVVLETDPLDATDLP